MKLTKEQRLRDCKWCQLGARLTYNETMHYSVYVRDRHWLCDAVRAERERQAKNAT